MVLLINLLIILSILFIAIMLFRCIQRKKQLLQKTNIKTFLGGVIGAGYGEETARKALETYSKTKDAKYPEIHAKKLNKCGYKNFETQYGHLKAGCKYPCENPIYNTKGLNWLYRNGNSPEVKNPIDNESTCLDFDGFNKSINIAFEYNGPFHYFSSGVNEKGLRDFFNSNLHEEIRKKSIIKQNKNKAKDIPSYRFIIIPYIWEKSNNIDNYVKSRLFDLGELKEEIKNEPFTFIAESKLKHSTKINTYSYKIAINDTFNNNNNLSTSLKEIVTKKLEGDMVVYITIYKELKEVKEANVQNTFLDCVYNPNQKKKNNITPIELWSREDFEILFKDDTFMDIINNPISDNYNELNKFISSIIIEKTENYIVNLKSNVPQVQQQLKEKADEKNRQSLLVPNPIWQQQYQQQPQYEPQQQYQQQQQRQYQQQQYQQRQQYEQQQQPQQQQYEPQQQNRRHHPQQRQNRRHHPYLRS